MAGFLYFLPKFRRMAMKASNLGLPELAEVLGEDASLEIGHLPQGGPGGGEGSMLNVFGTRQNRSYLPESQVWTSVHGEGGIRYWVGFDKEDPPTPKDLQRPQQIAGHPVKLGGGHVWTVPAITFHKDTLPKAFRYRGGEIQLEPQESFDPLVAEANSWFEWLSHFNEQTPDSPKKSLRDLYYFCVSLLALNYRVGPVECGSGVDWLTDGASTADAMLEAAFGIPDLRKEIEARDQKKMDEVGATP